MELFDNLNEIKSQLFSAPADIKSAFNNVVRYFSLYEIAKRHAELKDYYVGKWENFFFENFVIVKEKEYFSYHNVPYKLLKHFTDKNKAIQYAVFLAKNSDKKDATVTDLTEIHPSFPYLRGSGDYNGDDIMKYYKDRVKEYEPAKKTK